MKKILFLLLFCGNLMAAVYYGSYTAMGCDTGITEPVWGDFVVRKSTLTGTTMTLLLRVSADNITYDSWVEVTPQEQVEGDNSYSMYNAKDWVVKIPNTVASKRYIMWKSSFSTTDLAKSPNIWYAKITWFNKWNQYQSKVKTIPSNISKYGVFLTQDITKGNTAVHRVARSIISEADLLANPSWNTVTDGSDLNSTFSTNLGVTQYIMTDSSYTITYSTCPPYTEAIKLIWYEDSSTIDPAMVVYGDRLWVAMSTNTADSENDVIYVLGKNGNWNPPIIGVSPSHFWNFRGNLYFADSSSSTFFKYNSTTTKNNGSDITYEWRKDRIDFGYPNNDKNLKFVYITGTGKSGTLDFIYEIENSTISSTRTIDQSSDYDFKAVAPKGSSVRSFDYIIRSTSPFEVSEIRSYYILEDLR